MPSMIILNLVSYLGTIIAFVFATLSLACGLYYLAELVEEYTVLTKKIIKWLTVVVAVLHILLWIVDGLPFTMVMFSLACHGVYSLNLASFPFINLLSLPFIASCILVLVDHFMWFRYFSRYYYSFASIASFFGICVWMIPFTFFISLSANDNALPSFDRSNPDPSSKQQKKSGIMKSLFGSILSRKDNTPVLVETPRYSGFGSSLGSGSVGMGLSGAQASSSAYNTFQPERTLKPDYPNSRPSSRNSNHSGHHPSSTPSSPGYPQQHQHQQQQQQQHQHQQAYASSTSVYSHSGSTVGSRF